MKRLHLILYLLLLAILLVSCNGSKVSDESTAETTQETIDEDTIREIVLATDNRAAYKIIIPEDAPTTLSNAADMLKNKLNNKTGALFTVKDDYTRDGNAINSTGEIIIGNCKRIDMQSELSTLTYRDYSIKATDSNILIAGHETSKVVDAVYAFMKELENAKIEQSDAQCSFQWQGDRRNNYTSYKFENMTLGNVSLKDYSIIYPSGAYEAFYMEAALSVQSSIGRRCGFVLPIYSDAKSQQNNEILIGKTNRNESITFYESEAAPSGMEYGVAIQDQKILIASGGLYTLSSAADMFDTQIGSLKDGSVETIDQEKASLIKQPIPDVQGDYRFMTYNILVEYEGWGSGGIIPAQVELRKEIVSELILRYQPDVVGVQEVFNNWHDQLPELIEGSYAYVCMDRADGEANRSPLIYNKNKLAVLDSGYIDIEDSLTQNRRVITWACFENIETKEQFVVMNTHLDAHYQDKRLKQAEILANLVKRFQNEHSNMPIFALGDFNSVPNSQEYNTILTKSDLKNASETSGVDHIFCTKNVAVLAQGTERNNCAQYASDHYPVWIDVNLK